MIKAIEVSIEPAEHEKLLDGGIYRFSLIVDDKQYGYVLNQGQHIISAMGEEFTFRFFMDQVTNKVAEVAFGGADN